MKRKAATKTGRKFAPVAKSKRGVPLKYLAGLTGAARKKRESEILNASKQYKSGKLSKTAMNKLAKSRAKDAKKK